MNHHNDEVDRAFRKAIKTFAVILLAISSALIFLYIIPFWFIRSGMPYNVVESMRMLGAICIAISYIVLGTVLLVLEKKTRKNKK